MSEKKFDIPGHWTFKDDGVAGDFDTHVREQLPWYDLATRSVAHVARHYISEGGLVYDVGASTGNIGRALEPTLEARGAYLTAIEPSMEMATLYSGPGELLCTDVEDVKWQECDLIVCFLVLMFVKPAVRAGLIAKMRSYVRRGGALIIFDKREGAAGYPGTVLSRLTLAHKLEAGVSPERIIAKELSLAGSQRPMAPNELPDDALEWFRFGEFSGWLIEGK